MQHASFIADGNADPLDDVAQAQAAIRAAGWFGKADISEQWPLTTETAAELLSEAGEFRIDAEGLDDLITRRLLPGPGKGEVGFEWDATDLLRAGGLLEMRGQWRYSPSGHDPKKHPCQLILEQAREAGEVEAIVEGPGGHGPRLDVTHLLRTLAVCDAREGREKIIALLKATLEVEHGVLIP